ncbi:hypothetical protein BUALT_Bualt09G0072700 [Buddleja alternifolia]|uniref:HMG box domain-containing protein n=1 Tax=Buddleja alternifolia TaxID=168488 RepID=A0AAV6X7C7_9LAMI|nr:hypothetical protein BUALT_Bualt09G0072700 [Buddleja alternifolia]
MAGGSKSSNAPKSRKRVAAETSSSAAAVIKRAKDGSGFTKCEDCNKDVAMALIDFHSCSLDAKIKMNLEAQVVEIPKKPAVAAEKRKAKSSTTKTKKKGKNTNGRKRPPTAFFVFMDDFRKSFKAENPDCKSVATVAKEGGEKWKSMSDEEKKVYVDRAAELKAESYTRGI